MAILTSMVIGVVSEIMLEGMVMFFLCMLVMGIVAVVGLVWGGLLLLVQLGVVLKAAQERKRSESLDTSLAQGREVTIRHQDHNPVQVSKENQSQPKKEHD